MKAFIEELVAEALITLQTQNELDDGVLPEVHIERLPSVRSS